MRDITSLFPDRKGFDPDERTRRYITPVRVLWKQGKVSGEENLLRQRGVQITIENEEPFVMSNGEDGVNASILLDFGREMPGSLRILVWRATEEVKRTEAYSSAMGHFRIRLGESASEAMAEYREKNTTNNHAPRDFEIKCPSYGEVDTSESGFRFARIDLLGKNANVTIKSVLGVFIFRDLEYRGFFSCDDELVNRIYEVAAYTVHVNMQEYLWDGIKRDRLVWIGDMQTEVMAIEELFGFSSVVPKSLDLVRDNTPVEKWMHGISSYSLSWIQEHYDWYMAFGNKEYLLEQKDYMTALLKKVCALVDENGVERFNMVREENGNWKEEGRKFIDWPNNGKKQATHAGYQGLVKLTLEKGAGLCEVYGEEELALLCRETAKRMEKYRPDPDGSKQAASFLVMADLCDAEKTANELLLKDGVKGFSTFLGYYTLSAIAKAGKYAEALDCMKKYWGAMLELGATSFWEDFDIEWTENAGRIDELVPEGKKDLHGDCGRFCYEGFRHSLCHGWAGGPVPYLTQYVAGVTVLEPGCRKLRITPHLSGLKWIQCDFPTPYGVVKIDAREENGTTRLSVSAPKEVEISKLA